MDINALPDLYYTNGNTIPKIDGGAAGGGPRAHRPSWIPKCGKCRSGFPSAKWISFSILHFFHIRHWISKRDFQEDLLQCLFAIQTEQHPTCVCTLSVLSFSVMKKNIKYRVDELPKGAVEA